MQCIVATLPLELVHIDYPCLEPGKGKEQNVPVVTDHFTQYVLAYVTLSQMVQTVAKVLWDDFIVHYRLPEKIPSDQGRNFCRLTGTKKLRTSLYHPKQSTSVRGSTLP